MEYPISHKYNTPELLATAMGPNPFKLQEEMLLNHKIPAGSLVCDLGSGQGHTSVMLVKDSYNYWGRDPKYLDEKLLPFVKHGGYIYCCVPGLKKDCHDNLPKELLLSWTPEQLAYLRDIAYWTEILNSSRDAEVISIYEMESNENVWADWLNQEENEIAVDCRKTMDAGGGIYLNFIAFVLRKK